MGWVFTFYSKVQGKRLRMGPMSKEAATSFKNAANDYMKPRMYRKKEKGGSA